MDKVVDPRRKEKVNRYKPKESDGNNPQGEDPMPDYMNILGIRQFSTPIVSPKLYSQSQLLPSVH